MDQLCEQCSLFGRKIEAFLNNNLDQFCPFFLGLRRELSMKGTSCKLCSLITHALYSYDKNEAYEACEDAAEIECSIDDIDGNVLQLSGKHLGSKIRPLLFYCLCSNLERFSPVDLSVTNMSMSVLFVPGSNVVILGTTGSCNTIPNFAEQPNAPVWVINVIRKCLVSLPYLAEYVTLSHVWGQGKNLVMTTSNLRALENEGALNGDNVHVPRTVQDAMTLTSLIGERYLWVDALCIVQNDEAEKPQQIKEMDLMFARATISIIAAAADHADFGLPGVPGGIMPRHFEHNSARIYPSLSITVS